ncbi:MAG TPA: sigma-54-dependent Fis family transcriptional regulator [Nitrospirae bacterium]|nr:sigma-54-dependent Fis family transcriptional regulator [Nitrospirota bacterium]
MQPIVVVDDDPEMRNALEEAVKRFGFDVMVAESASEGMEVLKNHDCSLVITDMKMPGMNGLEFIRHIRKLSTTLPVLVITGFGTVENAVECMKLGASDYLMKPFSFDNLRQAITGLIEPAPANGEIITEDKSMKRLLRIAYEVARTDTTILITGESGTGKELIARYIHRQSLRREKNFVAVNCAAIPENLLESELFGHERGAFTGALEKKIGKFEIADGGTFLLDEIGEMSLPLQAKLLRVLQEREIDRIGSKKPLSINIRVITTTNRDLAGEVEKGNFREDLFYRISVFPLELPPLRERTSDVRILSEFFLKKHASQYGKYISGFSEDAFNYLYTQSWKGNIRELENVIQRAVLLSRSEFIESGDFMIEKSRNVRQDGKTIKEMEKDLILRTLSATNGNRTRTAECLGITVRTLRNKLNEYRLNA